MPALDYIQPAQPWQRGELEELERRSTDVWPAYREQLAAHPDAIVVEPTDIAAGHVRVAYDENADTVGFSVVVPIAPASGDPDSAAGGYELDGLFVDPLEFGLGIGRGLVEDAVARIRRLGGRYLTVITGPEAQGFYEKLGFEVKGRADTRFGPAVALRLDL